VRADGPVAGGSSTLTLAGTFTFTNGLLNWAGALTLDFGTITPGNPVVFPAATSITGSASLSVVQVNGNGISGTINLGNTRSLSLQSNVNVDGDGLTILSSGAATLSLGSNNLHLLSGTSISFGDDTTSGLSITGLGGGQLEADGSTSVARFLGCTYAAKIVTAGFDPSTGFRTERTPGSSLFANNLRSPHCTRRAADSDSVVAGAAEVGVQTNAFDVSGGPISLPILTGWEGSIVVIGTGNSFAVQSTTIATGKTARIGAAATALFRGAVTLSSTSTLQLTSQTKVQDLTLTSSGAATLSLNGFQLLGNSASVTLGSSSSSRVTVTGSGSITGTGSSTLFLSACDVSANIISGWTTVSTLTLLPHLFCMHHRACHEHTHTHMHAFASPISCVMSRVLSVSHILLDDRRPGRWRRHHFDFELG
jgi:fibronectin-binding autotransporter adhesin